LNHPVIHDNSGDHIEAQTYIKKMLCVYTHTHTHTHNRFTALLEYVYGL